MIVTQIEEINKKKCRIYLDGRRAFLLYKGEIRKIGLEENQEISEELYCYIMDDILKKRARSRALHILEKQEYTRMQLMEKLKKNEYPGEIVEDALIYVESYHYIDDERYARQFIRCRCKKRSKKQIFLDLQKRGIEKGIIQKAYNEISTEIDLQEEEDNLIDKIISKKIRNLETVTQKDIHKIYRFLISKGFSYDDINKHLKSADLFYTGDESQFYW